MVAVEDREVAVEDDHVVVVLERAGEAGVAVEGDVDGDAGVAQAGGDGVCQFLVVLDYKHAHWPLLVWMKVSRGRFTAVSPPRGAGARCRGGGRVTGRKPSVA